MKIPRRAIVPMRDLQRMGYEVQFIRPMVGDVA